jgi:hypothetical protein
MGVAGDGALHQVQPKDIVVDSDLQELVFTVGQTPKHAVKEVPTLTITVTGDGFRRLQEGRGDSWKHSGRNAFVPFWRRLFRQIEERRGILFGGERDCFRWDAIAQAAAGFAAPVVEIADGKHEDSGFRKRE